MLLLLAGTAGCEPEDWDWLPPHHPRPRTLGGLSPGDGEPMLDSSYGDSGRVEVRGSIAQYRTPSVANGLALTAAGQVMVTGRVSGKPWTMDPLGEVSGGLVVMRVLANGEIDLSFGEDGQAILSDDEQGTFTGHALFELEGGELLTLASSSHKDGSGGIGLWKTDSDGTPDESFGPRGFQGILDDPFARSPIDAPCAELDADGRVVVAATFSVGEDCLVLAARFTTDGMLDQSFGGGVGWVVLDTSPSSRATDVVIDANGAAYILGWTAVPDEILFRPRREPAVWRLTANGLIDRDYGNDGMALLCGNDPRSKGLDGRATSAVLDQHGRLVVAGDRAWFFSRWTWSYAFGTEGTPIFDVAVWRVLPGGSLDSGFGVGGEARLNAADVRGDYLEQATSLMLDASGRILIGGVCLQPDWSSREGMFFYQHPRPTLWRLDANGASDPSWAGGMAVFYKGDLIEGQARVTDLIRDQVGQVLFCVESADDLFWLTRLR